MTLFKSVLSAVGVEVETEESTETPAPAPATTKPSIPAPAAAVSVPVPAPQTSAEVSQAEAEAARTKALMLADYKSCDVLQRYMVMEAKSKTDDGTVRASEVLEALKDAADVNPDAVIAQAKRAADRLRAQMIAQQQEVATVVKNHSTERGNEAKTLEAAIAQDTALMQQAQARIQRAQSELSGLDGKYAAMSAAATRSHDIFTQISNQFLAKWDTLTNMRQKDKP